MVVLNRIAYLRGLAQYGARLTFSVSVNASTGIQKIKVIVDPSGQIPLDEQYCTLGMLDFLTTLCATRSVADKGHKHTCGTSEVAFYITTPSTLVTQAAPNDSSPADASSMPLDTIPEEHEESKLRDGDSETQNTPAEQPGIDIGTEVTNPNLLREAASQFSQDMTEHLAFMRNSVLQLHTIIVQSPAVLAENIHRPLLARSAVLMGKSRRLDNAAPCTRATLLKELSDAFLALQDDLRVAVTAVSLDAAPQPNSISSPSRGLQLAAPSQRGMASPKRNHSKKRR